MKNLLASFLLLAIAVAGCGTKDNDFDASGTFETDEVIVSSELAGKLLNFDVEEGQHIERDSVVAIIDAGQIRYQKEQVEESISALNAKTTDVEPQINLLNQQLEVQRAQLDNLRREQTRVENLVKQDAATGKQLDDINASIEVMKQQMLVTQRQVAAQKTGTSSLNRGVMSEKKPLQKRVAQLDDQLERARIINPISGVVIAKYAEEGEITAAGKALYKVADISTMYLRAYITGTQLPQIKIGQPVDVFLDSGQNKYRQVPGVITWIADKAEFTPKTIQTKEERANLVYAIKVKVKNDGFIKIGMYGEIKFQQ